MSLELTTIQCFICWEKVREREDRSRYLINIQLLGVILFLNQNRYLFILMLAYFENFPFVSCDIRVDTYKSYGTRSQR